MCNIAEHRSFERFFGGLLVYFFLFSLLQKIDLLRNCHVLLA